MNKNCRNINECSKKVVHYSIFLNCVLTNGAKFDIYIFSSNNNWIKSCLNLLTCIFKRPKANNRINMNITKKW
jgi:hypothetical protein